MYAKEIKHQLVGERTPEREGKCLKKEGVRSSHLWSLPEGLLSDISLTFPEVKGQIWSFISFSMAVLHQERRCSDGHSMYRTWERQGSCVLTEKVGAQAVSVVKPGTRGGAKFRYWGIYSKVKGDWMSVFKRNTVQLRHRDMIITMHKSTF